MPALLSDAEWETYLQYMGEESLITTAFEDAKKALDNRAYNESVKHRRAFNPPKGKEDEYNDIQDRFYADIKALIQKYNPSQFKKEDKIKSLLKRPFISVDDFNQLPPMLKEKYKLKHGSQEAYIQSIYTKIEGGGRRHTRKRKNKRKTTRRR